MKKLILISLILTGSTSSFADCRSSIREQILSIDRVGNYHSELSDRITGARNKAEWIKLSDHRNSFDNAIEVISQQICLGK